MEETDIKNHQVSDSGYSNSCNSQSQRSSGSSKSRHSNSSGSSGYGGHPSTVGSGNEVFPHPSTSKRNKDREHKKKKLKSSVINAVINNHHNSKNLISSLNSGLENSTASSGKASCKTSRKCASTPLLSISNQETVPKLEPAHGSLGQPPGKEEVEAHREDPQLSGNLAVEVVEQEWAVNGFGSGGEAETHIEEDEFSTVVSLHDGVVMHATSSITTLLGYPKDMWLGRSFIDFVHPKDRMAFASHITTEVVPVEESHSKVIFTPKDNFYCCLRQYRGLKSNGFGIAQKKITYLPFHLSMTFREVTANEKLSLSAENPGLEGKFLIIIATLLKSSYTQSNETKLSSKFKTRHQATGLLDHVDPEAVPYLGYLPQDMVGRSIFDFYHPEDSPFLKEVYGGIIRAQGLPFRSKPYRFQVQNGGYVLLETEWSAFINPWSRKLEFIVGQHRVLKGPLHPNVFASPIKDNTFYISEAVLKESKIIQEEIENLLTETVPRDDEKARFEVSQRCHDLANFMETLMDEVPKKELKVEVPPEEQSFSERDSVMLGEISPHHDYYDSKSSSETPPSYNQMNYNENIQRFFESKPKTTFSDVSGETKIEANRSHNSTDEEGKSMPVADSSLDSGNRKSCSPINGSGSGSGDSSGSARVLASAVSRGNTSPTNTSHGSCKLPHLTEALLSRHNEDMEKMLAQRHRKSRTKSDRDSKRKHRESLQDQSHGVKRSGSNSLEGEPNKASKHTHMETASSSGRTAANAGNNASPAAAPPMFPAPSNFVWPPFSVTVSSQPCTGQNFTNATTVNNPVPHLANMIPMMYFPASTQQPGLPYQGLPHQGVPHQGVPHQGLHHQGLHHQGLPQQGLHHQGLHHQGLRPQEHPGFPHMAPPGMLMQVQFVNPLNGMIYHPMQSLYGAAPMMYSPFMLQPSAVLPTPMVQTGLLNPASRAMKHSRFQPKTGPSGMGPSTKFQRPASQATSVKAEPGSAMGSIASASINRAMSEGSKKEKCFPDAQTSSPETSPDEDKPNNNRIIRDFRVAGGGNTTDESSYSSFYSLLRTDNSDESMNCFPQEKELSYPRKPQDMMWGKSEHKSTGPEEKPRPVLKDPPWLEEVDVTPDLVYRYQMEEKSLESVLERDLQALKKFQQPQLVNEQLSQLYMEMELEGLSTKLKLEERMTSSSSGSGSSGEESHSTRQKKRKRRNLEYNKMVMLFEENAPFPPPVSC